jgi:glycine/D-amino acid oxidase-like deaminating enzyme
MRPADLAIVGLGVQGSGAARAFAARGWRVVGIEQSPAGRVRGASSGPFRMVRTNDPARAELAGAAMESISQWRNLSDSRPEPFFRAVPGIFAEPGGDSDGVRVAGLAVPAGWTVTRHAGCGLLDAQAAVFALRDEAKANGAELLFGKKAILTGRSGTSVLLRVGDQTVAADSVLFCVGAWTPELPASVRVAGLRVERAYMQVATFAGESGLFGADSFFVLRDGDDRFCVIPLPDGKSVQFGHYSAVSSRDDRIWRRDIDALRRFAPDIGKVHRRTTVEACYTTPPDGAFVIRRASARLATLVACSGAGFKYAPAIADQVVAVFEGRAAVSDILRVESGGSWKGTGAVC